MQIVNLRRFNYTPWFLLFPPSQYFLHIHHAATHSRELSVPFSDDDVNVRSSFFFVLSFLLRFKRIQFKRFNGSSSDSCASLLFLHIRDFLPRYSPFWFCLSFFVLHSFHSIYESITDHKNYWNEMNGNRWLPHCLPFLFLQHCSPNWLSDFWFFSDVCDAQ